MTQSRVIDVAHHAVQRERAPMIRFRRTEQDRRPARPVLRPNDGPGDLRERERLARLQAENLKAKTIALFGERPASHADRHSQQRAERKVAILRALSAKSLGLNLISVANLVGCSTDAASKLLIELAAAGLVYRVLGAPAAGGKVLKSTITPKGLDSLEGLET